MLTVGLLGAGLWLGSSPGAQILSSFTDPAGGTLAIPVTQIISESRKYNVLMKRIIKKMVKGLLHSNAGKKRLQWLYEHGFHIAVGGMNYGNGGTYSESGEMHVLEMIRERFKNEERIVIFDVGANIGGYARTVTDLLGPKAQVHSFEPSHKCFETFGQTTKGIPNIVANNFGFSSAPGSQTLYSDSDDSGLASLYHRKLDHYGINMDKTEVIELSTIDDHCCTNNIDRIHFLKLDIEGHELSALKGASRMLSEERIDVIQFEFGGCNIDSRTYFQDFFYLLNEKYKINRIVKDGLVEIPKYFELHEIFITTNYLAIHR